MNTTPFTNPCPAIFSPVTAALAQELSTDSFCLQADFALAKHATSSITIVLTSSHLLLCQTAPLLPLYAVELQFALKFELIYDLDGLKSHDLAVQSPVTGVRFIVESTAVDFYFACLGLTSLWSKYLGKQLNQVGFHRLYKPIRKLGKGASATVYEVERTTDKQRFAVKAFSKASTLLSSNPIHRETLLNEIELMRAWDSPHLLKLEGVFESDNSLYLVMELLADGQLHTRINQKQAKFAMSEIKQFMHGLASGLKEMHELRVMHRDIKPENIMLRGSTGLQPVIVDYGLAADVDSEDYLYYRCGTPGYVAPEITTLKKGEKVAPECDIFSAGVILHILLLKRPLFEGKNCDEVYDNNRKMKFNLNAPAYKQVDPVGLDLLRKMLRTEPAQRITAAEILAHPFLAELAQEKQVLSPASTANSCDINFADAELCF